MSSNRPTFLCEYIHPYCLNLCCLFRGKSALVLFPNSHVTDIRSNRQHCMPVTKTMTKYFLYIDEAHIQQRLRLASCNCLTIPISSLTTVGKQVFPVSGANIWNDWPPGKSHLHRRSLNSGRFWRHFYSVVDILTSSFDKRNIDMKLATVYYLDHFRYIYDDDNDDRRRSAGSDL